MSLGHKGDTPSKNVNRRLVWLQHQRLLGSNFGSVPHVFLASRHAGDVDCLLAMGVVPRNVWAVEKEREQYRHLIARQNREGFHLYTRAIEEVVNHSTPSVYLDFCGNLNGSKKAIREVVSYLPAESALSVTLFIGREQDALVGLHERETRLISLVKDSATTPVRLVQSVYYISAAEGIHGSPMATWTFYFGTRDTRSIVRFDLSHMEADALTEDGAHQLWTKGSALAEVRSRAAAKANRSRRSDHPESR